MKGGENGIRDIERWLEELKAGSGAIRNAGLASGVTQAGKDGLKAIHDRDTVYVTYRGRSRLPKVRQAISDGMVNEFERRA